MFYQQLIVFLAITMAICVSGTKHGPERGPKDDGFSSLPPADQITAANLGGFKEVEITASDGIIIRAIIFDPKPAAENAKNPLLIFMSSWGMNKWEYVVPAHEYAERGYTVVSYTSRGFWGSGGEINLAGALDMADVTTVIDWALDHTNADENRIGLSGISYGGGISLLATAHEKRIKSAVSMSCWVDLAESFLGNGETIRKEAVTLLDVLGKLTGTYTDDLKTLFSDYLSNTDLAFLYQFTYNSSAVNYLDQINANKPAIFIANALSDSLFTPNQFPAFFNKLNLNKHLEFAPGDHAGPELSGLLGIPNQVWTRAQQWNDYYVRDAKTDGNNGLPMVVFNTVNGDEIEAYNSWDEVTNGYATFDLSKDEKLVATSSSTNKEKNNNLKGSNEVVTIKTGENANIDGGVAFITATIRSVIQEPLHFPMYLIRRKYAAVFQTDKLDYSLRIRGNPTLKLNFIPQSTNGTVVVYLLDVNRLTDIGALMTFSPWTFKNAIVGQVNTVEIEITTSSYDLPAGHRLAAVIQTHDKLFLDQNPKDVDLTFATGSSLSIPLHN